ncbi:MAG TPA: hypothetical protein VMI73_13475 [Trebonia sp.]|nr:hypothetical protein [Trebonia sp.]
MKLPDAAAVVLDAGAELGALDADVALAAGEAVLVTLDVLLPHAAINTVAAPTATVAANLVGLTVSSRGKVPRRPHDEGAYHGQTARRLFRWRV